MRASRAVGLMTASIKSGPLLVEHAGGICRTTFNRPEIHNAQNPEMLELLDATLDRLACDRTARVVVLAGAGASFCSGHDRARCTTITPTGQTRDR